jgi:hypothetical protein
MPQSRNRSSRAAERARYRKPKRRRGGSFGWNIAIIVVVIVGVLAVVLTVSGGSNSSDGGSGPPRAVDQATGTPGDHWHTAFGVNICGEWLTPPGLFDKAFNDQSSPNNVGIHTHGDGLIHTHPFYSSEQGTNATFGKFLKYGGWTINPDTIDIGSGYPWSGPGSAPKEQSWSNGDKCSFGQYKGQTAHVVWSLDGKLQTGNPSDYHQQDGVTIAVGFLPKGAELGFPPFACNAFATISDQNTAAVVSNDSPCRDQSSTSTTAPAATATTQAP